MSEPARLRLVNVEDDPRYRSSLSLLLRSLPEFEVGASYSSATALLDTARKARALDMPAPWDVVLTDMGLPGVDGVELTRELKTLFPSLRVIVLTVFDEPASVLDSTLGRRDEESGHERDRNADHHRELEEWGRNHRIGQRPGQPVRRPDVRRTRCSDR